jgi:SAM-dependent methyltransferase
MKAWYEDDLFWLHFAPVMFQDERWAAAGVEARETARLLGMPEGGALMDSCCGVGRHTVEFARMGFQVTGVDRTEGYLEAAQETADAEGVVIEFIQGDIREFVRPEYFDGIANLFTSFGYFESIDEDVRTLQNYYESLKIGGKVIIDVIGKELLARNFQPSEWYEYDGGYVIAEYGIIEDWSRLLNRWIYYRDGSRFEYTFSHRVYSAAELEGLLRRTGFGSIQIFGDFDSRPYDARAERLIIVAEKPSTARY